MLPANNLPKYNDHKPIEETAMLRMIKSISLIAGLLMSAVSIAQAPAGAPAGSTGLCRDGTYWSAPVKKGACHGHKGVQDWYGAKGAAGSAAAPAAPAASAAPATAAPAAASAPAPKHGVTPPAAAAPGGGAGQVWVNSSSKVYHCPSDRWYGKTKNGAYMTEAEAVTQGNRPDHGKACH